MNKKPKIEASDFIRFRREQEQLISNANREIESARKRVRFPKAEELRPARSADIRKGNVIFYLKRPMVASNTTRPAYWQIIEEVYHPNDDFKAYMAEDGCRYGLDGAYVLN